MHSETAADPRTRPEGPASLRVHPGRSRRRRGVANEQGRTRPLPAPGPGATPGRDGRQDRLSPGQARSLLEQPPCFEDISCGLEGALRISRTTLRETREVVALARRFNEEVVRPSALDLDSRMHQEPGHLPWEFVHEANNRGFYTAWIPRLFGGKGYPLPSLSHFIEEISSECLGMANLIGVHYLGVSALFASWNLPLIRRILEDTVRGERSRAPCLIATAITEPGAGTDVEDVELLDRGRVTCRARKVQGGFRLSGTKVFISNGHLSSWHIVIAYRELERPAANTVMLAVERGRPGFTLGRMERKMGQKACPASELVFDDCFVPSENVLADLSTDVLDPSRSRKETAMRALDSVLAASRAGVGAFGTGVARGALAETIRYAREAQVEGRPLINHEWVQSLLAEMYTNVAVARLAYMEANHANGLYGLFRLLGKKPLSLFLRHAPEFVFRRVVPGVLDSPLATKLARAYHFQRQEDRDLHRASGWGSLAKLSGTDAGVRNCHLALEIMGQDGLRHDRRVEKHFRDAKLLQIYEGTNQLNRLNLFRSLVGAFPGVELFED